MAAAITDVDFLSGGSWASGVPRLMRITADLQGLGSPLLSASWMLMFSGSSSGPVCFPRVIHQVSIPDKEKDKGIKDK